MRSILHMLIVVVLAVFLAAEKANAEVFLISPSDESAHETPPNFEWTEAQFNTVLFISVFYYDIPGGFRGYYPVTFLAIGTGFPMSAAWWNLLGESMQNFWGVYEFNDTGGAASDIYWFIKGMP